MKKLIPLILTVILLLSLLSCATTPAAPETSEPTVPTEVLVSFESAYMGIGVLGIEPQTQDDFDSYEKVIVVRSVDALLTYEEKLDEVLAGCYADVCNNENLWKGMVKSIGVLSDALKAFERYHSEAFFEENVLLLLQTRSHALKVHTNKAYLTETDGKKQLHIENLLLRSSDFTTDGTPGITTVLVAIPNDLGVDLENDVIVSWEDVKDTLYLVSKLEK